MLLLMVQDVPIPRALYAPPNKRAPILGNYVLFSGTYVPIQVFLHPSLWYIFPTTGTYVPNRYFTSIHMVHVPQLVHMYQYRHFYIPPYGTYVPQLVH